MSPNNRSASLANCLSAILNDLEQENALPTKRKVIPSTKVERELAKIQKLQRQCEARIARLRTRFRDGLQGQRQTLYLTGSEEKRRMLCKEGVLVGMMISPHICIGKGQKPTVDQLRDAFSTICVLLDETNLFSWSTYDQIVDLANPRYGWGPLGETRVQIKWWHREGALDSSPASTLRGVPFLVNPGVGSERLALDLFSSLGEIFHGQISMLQKMVPFGVDASRGFLRRVEVEVLRPAGTGVTQFRKWCTEERRRRQYERDLEMTRQHLVA